MDYICGYFDAQGFYSKDQFYPREIALLSKSVCVGLNINHGLRLNEQTLADVARAEYNTRFIHGLSFKGKNAGMSISAMRVTILEFYETYRDADRFLIACKNKEAEAILRSLKIPRINLETYGANWNSSEFTNFRACHLHEAGKDRKCSLVAVNGLKEWVEKRLNQESLKEKIKRKIEDEKFIKEKEKNDSEQAVKVLTNPRNAGFDEPDRKGHDQPDRKGNDQPDRKGNDEPDRKGYDEPYLRGFDETDRASVAVDEQLAENLIDMKIIGKGYDIADCA